MLQLLRTLLNKQLKKGKLTPEQSQELLQSIQTGVDHVIKFCQQEKDQEEAVSMTFPANNNNNNNANFIECPN